MAESPQQGELLLAAPPLSEGAPLLPARMVNEYVYCPRLAYLEWVQGEWAENGDTVAGAYVVAASTVRTVRCRRPRNFTRLVSHLIAKIDLVESDTNTVVPVDYKRGKRPHVSAGACEPERVQLCVQGLPLEEWRRS